MNFIPCCPLLMYTQKYPPSATTLHFEFYAEPGPEVKVERKVKAKIIYVVIRQIEIFGKLLISQTLFCTNF